MIKALHNVQGGNIISYVIENVPNSARFGEITDALGPTIIVDAHKLGNSTLRKTALWTNAATYDFLFQHYEDIHYLGDKVPMLLSKHGFADSQSIAYTGDYFPKFMKRSGSWMYSFIAGGKPRPGRLLLQGTLQEPSLVMKELAMGYTMGTTTTEGLFASMRHKLLGACLDHNVSTWLMKARQAYAQSERAHRNVTASNYNQPDYPDNRIVDTGATTHFTGHRSDFSDYQEITPGLVHGMNLYAVGSRTVKVIVPTKTINNPHPGECTFERG